MAGIEPRLPSSAYRTFQVAAPLSTHWRQATCAEFDCPKWRTGWRTGVDERTELGMMQAYYLRHRSGRGFREERNAAGLTVFVFEPGQSCFKAAEHRVRTERPEFFVVRHGDHRASTVERVHSRAADWTDQFAEHQGRWAEIAQRG